MATVAPIARARTANPITFTAANGGGDTFANSGRELLLVRHTNGVGSAVTLTVATTETVDGLAVADLAVVIDPGETQVLGPFPKAIYDNSSGNVALSWSSATDIEVAVIAGE